MASLTSYSASDYESIVEAGKSCVDDIIAQMNAGVYLRAVKASITNSSGDYSVRVYYQYDADF